MQKRLAWIFLLFLSGCSSCEKAHGPFAPESLAGKTIHATAIAATGGFAETMAPGYTFDTALGNDKTFKTTSTGKGADSSGTFTYVRVDTQTGKLTLTDTSSLHKGEAIEVTLSFTSPKLGEYSVHVLTGQGGEQSGTFELR